MSEILSSMTNPFLFFSNRPTLRRGTQLLLRRIWQDHRTRENNSHVQHFPEARSEEGDMYGNREVQRVSSEKDRTAGWFVGQVFAFRSAEEAHSQPGHEPRFYHGEMRVLRWKNWRENVWTWKLWFSVDILHLWLIDFKFKLDLSCFISY